MLLSSTAACTEERVFSLEFHDNGTCHKDIWLRFGNWARLCDSYYLGLDSPSDLERVNRVRNTLRVLLEQWLCHIKAAAAGQTIYLPFDFSDERTGCLRCQFSDDRVTVTLGWSRIEGWRVSPTDIGAYVWSVGDFRSDEPGSITMSRGEFIQSIESNLAQKR
jgi:hypothetical protein